MPLEMRLLGGRFLYRLKGQTLWHTNKGDAYARKNSAQGYDLVAGNNDLPL